MMAFSSCSSSYLVKLIGLGSLASSRASVISFKVVISSLGLEITGFS